MANAIPHKLCYQDCPHSIQYLTNDCLIPLGKRLTPRCMLTAFCWGEGVCSDVACRIALQNPHRIPNPHCVPKSASRFRIRIAIREFIALQKRIAIGGFVAFYVTFSNCHPRGG